MANHVTPTTSNDSYNKYVEASVLGALRALAGLPIEHPFDTVKTVCQAEQTPAWKVTQQIWNQHGIRGYYSGAIPNSIRASGKQAYRYPMMMSFPAFFKEALPKDVQNKYPTSIQTCTGLTIAIFEAGIICPFERMKVYFQTNDAKQYAMTQFFKEHRHKMFPELKRGLGAVFTRQIVTWVSFLVADKKFKDMEKRRIQSDQLPFSSLMKVSVEVGLVNTLANMPFDTVKTNLQKKNHVETTGVIKTMHKIYSNHGLKGLYAGWQIRMLQYMIQSVFTVSVLDHLERSWKK